MKIVASYTSFTAFLVRSVFCSPTHLLCVMVSFSCTFVSQGNVATQLMCGGLFSNHLISNCPQNAAVKKNFFNGLKILRRYGQ